MVPIGSKLAIEPEKLMSLQNAWASCAWCGHFGRDGAHLTTKEVGHDMSLGYHKNAYKALQMAYAEVTK